MMPTPCVFQAFDELPHHSGLFRSQGGGRFVHDQYASVEIDGPANRDALTLSARHVHDWVINLLHFDVKLVEDFLGLIARAVLIQEPQTPPRRQARPSANGGFSTSGNG